MTNDWIKGKQQTEPARQLGPKLKNHRSRVSKHHRIRKWLFFADTWFGIWNSLIFRGGMSLLIACKGLFLALCGVMLVDGRRHYKIFWNNEFWEQEIKPPFRKTDKGTKNKQKNNGNKDGSHMRMFVCKFSIFVILVNSSQVVDCSHKKAKQKSYKKKCRNQSSLCIMKFQRKRFNFWLLHNMKKYCGCKLPAAGALNLKHGLDRPNFDCWLKFCNYSISDLLWKSFGISHCIYCVCKCKIFVIDNAYVWTLIQFDRYNTTTTWQAGQPFP